MSFSANLLWACGSWAKLFCPGGGAAWSSGCSGCTCRLGFEEWSGEAGRIGGELENCSVNYFFFTQTSVSNGILEIRIHTYEFLQRVILQALAYGKFVNKASNHYDNQYLITRRLSIKSL